MAFRRVNLMLGAQMVSCNTYCPTSEDFDLAYHTPYGNVTAEGNGLRLYGRAGVNGRTSWNLLGGYIEFDMDVCGAQPGISSSVYTISPDGGLREPSDYCDKRVLMYSCMELDMVESYGQCLGQTTWHVSFDDCGPHGCRPYGRYRLDDGCKFHMRTEFGEDGSLTQYRNGQVIQVAGLSTSDKVEIKQTMERAGALITSSSMEGGRDLHDDHGSCHSGGDWDTSQFAITNVVVHAPRGITFGPTPPVCSAPTLNVV